jgi:hypothetical protein
LYDIFILYSYNKWKVLAINDYLLLIGAIHKLSVQLMLWGRRTVGDRLLPQETTRQRFPPTCKSLNAGYFGLYEVCTILTGGDLSCVGDFLDFTTILNDPFRAGNFWHIVYGIFLSPQLPVLILDSWLSLFIEWYYEQNCVSGHEKHIWVRSFFLLSQ